jgi:hypothetical protein
MPPAYHKRANPYLVVFIADPRLVVCCFCPALLLAPCVLRVMKAALVRSV